MSPAQTVASGRDVSLFEQLLADGIPATLLIDLIDPEGMRIALASELAEHDVAQAPAPPVSTPARPVRSVRSA